MDSLRSSAAPLHEYLLQGSILDSHRDLLLHRLNGLCDNTESGPEKFHDQELVYTLRMYISGLMLISYCFQKLIWFPENV